MTIQEYLTNPAGKGSSVLGDQSIIKEKYEEEAQSLISSGKGIPNEYSLRKRYLIFHYQIESKSGSKYGTGLHYDILIQIDTKTYDLDTTKLGDMEFQVFSNCPSFLYTYANLFNKKKLLIEWTKKLYDKDTLRKTAKERNSYGIIGYERSLYITLLLINYVYGKFYAKDMMQAATAISSPDTLVYKIQSQTQMRRSFSDAKDLYKKNQALANSQSIKREKRTGDDVSDLSRVSSVVSKTKKTQTVKKSKKI